MRGTSLRIADLRFRPAYISLADSPTQTRRVATHSPTADPHQPTSYFDLKNGAGRWVGFGRAATDLVGSGGHSPQLVLLTGPGC